MINRNGELNGIICVDKPAGFTSFDVIAKMRGILKMKRLGHAGTLDPMATGVLPVFAGKATRACDIIPDRDKEYEAGFRLGIVTDTQDITGKIISEKAPENISEGRIEKALAPLRGEIMQLPPMYSAVMVNGKRLYELARQGIEAERKPRSVTVYSLELMSYDENSFSGILKIACSKGTYVRTLINDMGASLGCGAAMTSLVRTKACGFDLSDCVTLSALQELVSSGQSPEKYLCPIEKVFGDLREIRLDPVQEKMYRNGVRLDTGRIKAQFSDDPDEKYRVLGADGSFIGIARVSKAENELRAVKNF